VYSNSESSYPDQWLANERAYLSEDGLKRVEIEYKALSGHTWHETYHQVFRRNLIVQVGYDELRV
jgi:hypothetical protein